MPVSDTGGVVAALGRYGVKLVEEKHARRGGSSASKHVTHSGLARADVLVQQLWALHRHAAHAQCSHGGADLRSSSSPMLSGTPLTVANTSGMAAASTCTVAQALQTRLGKGRKQHTQGV